jgi:hypothetical protein
MRFSLVYLPPLTQVHWHRDAGLTESSVIGWISRRYAPRCPCSPIDERFPRKVTRNAVGFPKALHSAFSSLSRLLGHSHQKGLFEQSPLGKKADSSKPHWSVPSSGMSRLPLPQNTNATIQTATPTATMIWNRRLATVSPFHFWNGESEYSCRMIIGENAKDR